MFLKLGSAATTCAPIPLCRDRDPSAEPLVFHPPASETGCRGRVLPKPGWCGARPRLPEIGVEAIKLVNTAAEWRRGLTKVAMSRSAGATGASVRVDVPSVDRKPPPTSTVERLLYLMTVAGLTPIAAIAKTKRQRLSRVVSSHSGVVRKSRFRHHTDRARRKQRLLVRSPRPQCQRAMAPLAAQFKNSGCRTCQSIVSRRRSRVNVAVQPCGPPAKVLRRNGLTGSARRGAIEGKISPEPRGSCHHPHPPPCAARFLKGRRMPSAARANTSTAKLDGSGTDVPAKSKEKAPAGEPNAKTTSLLSSPV